MNIETLLHEEIEQEFSKLKEMEVGSDEYKAAIDGITKLTDRAIEIDKINVEHDTKVKEMDEEKKDRFVKNCIAVGTVAASTVLTVWGTFKTFRFEQEGTITSMAGRGFITRLFPKK